MARNDAVALQRMAKHGYTGSKDRTDNCKGCHHSSPYVHGQKGTLKCRHMGLFVSSGAKCSGWVARGTDLGLRPVATAVENDCEDQGASNVSEGCNKWPCDKEPLVKADIGWRCTKCGGSY